MNQQNSPMALPEQVEELGADEIGPEHWTRDDIDALLGAIFEMAEAVKRIAEFADAIKAQAQAQAQG